MIKQTKDEQQLKKKNLSRGKVKSKDEQQQDGDKILFKLYYNESPRSKYFKRKNDFVRSLKDRRSNFYIFVGWVWKKAMIEKDPIITYKKFEKEIGWQFDQKGFYRNRKKLKMLGLIKLLDEVYLTFVPNDTFFRIMKLTEIAKIIENRKKLDDKEKW